MIQYKATNGIKTLCKTYFTVTALSTKSSAVIHFHGIINLKNSSVDNRFFHNVLDREAAVKTCHLNTNSYFLLSCQRDYFTNVFFYSVFYWTVHSRLLIRFQNHLCTLTQCSKKIKQIRRETRINK